MCRDTETLAAPECLAPSPPHPAPRAACDVLQRALAPWFGTGTFNSRDSVGRRAVLAALAAALAHDDAGTRIAVSRETMKLLDGSWDLPGDGETTLAACRAAFDVSRSPAHDALFFDEKVVPGLVRYAARGAAELQGGSEEDVEALSCFPAMGLPGVTTFKKVMSVLHTIREKEGGGQVIDVPCFAGMGPEICTKK